MQLRGAGSLPSVKKPGSGSVGSGSVGSVGSTALGCTTRYASGWFRLQCGTNNRIGGPPQSLTVLSGGTTSTSVQVSPGTAIDMMTPFSAGDSLTAKVVWQEAEHVLQLDWPAGSAKPAFFGYFEGMNTMPDPAEFDKVKDVTVTGSSALKCSTKYIPGWFRAVCIGSNDTGGLPKEIKVLSGVEEKDMSLHTDKGLMSLTAKVQAGTKLTADFIWTDKTMQLLIDWPEKKPQPNPFGKLVAAEKKEAETKE